MHRNAFRGRRPRGDMAGELFRRAAALNRWSG